MSITRFLGWFALDGSGNDEYELGYRLARSAWGRGLATEGSLALIERAVTELRVRRVRGADDDSQPRRALVVTI